MIAPQTIEFKVIKTDVIQWFILFVVAKIVFSLRGRVCLRKIILCKILRKTVFRTAMQQVWFLCKTNLEKLSLLPLCVLVSGGNNQDFYEKL